MSKSYAGIGSRETPEDICKRMELIGLILAKAGWTLRSGAAPNADTAFEYGCKKNDGKMEIYLPWKGFEDRPSKWPYVQGGMPALAYSMAQKVMEDAHWRKLSAGAQKLHARNAHQVMGLYLNDPVKFVVCWTEGGKLKGGTATAIKMAKARAIPVFNFGNMPIVDVFRSIDIIHQQNL